MKTKSFWRRRRLALWTLGLTLVLTCVQAWIEVPDGGKTHALEARTQDWYLRPRHGPIAVGRPQFGALPRRHAFGGLLVVAMPLWMLMTPILVWVAWREFVYRRKERKRRTGSFASLDD